MPFSALDVCLLPRSHRSRNCDACQAFDARTILRTAFYA